MHLLHVKTSLICKRFVQGTNSLMLNWLANIFSIIRQTILLTHIKVNMLLYINEVKV